MKRFHVHLSVESIPDSVRFYSALFATQPTVLRSDYAQSEKSWIEDPQGVKWETFLTTGESTVYGSEEPDVARGACCEPTVAVAAVPAVPKARCCG